MSVEKIAQYISEQAHKERVTGFRAFDPITEQVIAESSAHKNWFKGEFGKHTTGSVDSGGRGGRVPMGGTTSLSHDAVKGKLEAAGFKKSKSMEHNKHTSTHTYSKPSKSGSGTHHVHVTVNNHPDVKSVSLRPETTK
jgi:hypothetical protein